MFSLLQSIAKILFFAYIGIHVAGSMFGDKSNKRPEYLKGFELIADTAVNGL